MRCDSLNCSAKDRQQLLPIVNDNQSDSGALDNVMELLVRSGRDIAEVMMMLIPEAWQNDALMPADRKAFYQCALSPDYFYFLCYCIVLPHSCLGILNIVFGSFHACFCRRRGKHAKELMHSY